MFITVHSLLPLSLVSIVMSIAFLDVAAAVSHFDVFRDTDSYDCGTFLFQSPDNTLVLYFSHDSPHDSPTISIALNSAILCYFL